MATADQTKQAQWQKLFGCILGYQATWIVDIGLKAGLFRAVADAPRGITEEVLAQRLGFNERYVRVVCHAACAFGLFDWDLKSGYRLAPHMEDLLLNPKDAQFIGERMQFYAALYEDFAAFPRYLRSGGVWPQSAHAPWLLEALRNLFKADALMINEAVLPQAPTALARLEAGGSLLDIGSGGGHSLIHYATRFPRAKVVGMEIDAPSIEAARRSVAEAGLTDRIEIREGDPNALDEEEAFDVITFNIVLHETGGPREYRNVLSRVYRALRPGGAVVVAELPYPDSPTAYRTHPVYQALAGVQLHEALAGCGMTTRNELRGLLHGVGFANVREAHQPMPTRFVMLAER